VPATDEQGPALELAPVFAALSTDVKACENLVEDARRQAAQEVAAAQKQAGVIVSRARLGAGAVRAEAAARVEREAGERVALMMEQARRDADALEESGLARVPAIVGRAIDTLLTSWPDGRQ
jgi:hypothetical protein